MNKNEVDELAPEEERLEALHRTLEETAVPPELDIRAVVGGAVEAYWAGVDRSSSRLSAGIEEYTAAWLRKAGALIRPREDFWSEALLSMVPVALALLTIYVPVESGLILSRWIVVAGVLISAVGSIFLIALRRRAETTRFFAAQHFSGALLGGLVIAAVVGVWSFHQASTTAGVTLDLAETKLSRIVLSSLENRVVNGKFLDVSSSGTSPTVEIVVDSISPNRVIYRADSKELPGRLIADLAPNTGDIVWHSNRGEVLRLRVTVGTIEQGPRGGLLLRQTSGKGLVLNLDDLAITEPKAGRCAVVAFKPDNAVNLVKDIQRFDCARRLPT
ncbi:MAG TPA: hypothetical protein VLV54_14665 [Thermoanaerobaculia bacterium]|nr:hypothetical protein [Thermoanaerobaculia bacterium]